MKRGVCDIYPFFLAHHPDARGDSKGGGNGGQYGDEDVDDFKVLRRVFLIVDVDGKRESKKVLECVKRPNQRKMVRILVN